MNIQRANFEDILTAYYNNTDAHLAVEHLGSLIRDGQGMRLATLLRDYNERPVSDPEEIRLRAATDRLLTCCSILEITSLAGFIADAHLSDFGKAARPILENEQVRRYYEELYPMKLPRLFRRRLAGGGCVIDTGPDDTGANGNVTSFLDLDRRFTQKLEDRTLLRMLDSFQIHGYQFDDVVEVISKPEEFIEHLLYAPEQRTVLSDAIGEFSLFMQFCFDLRDILTGKELRPLLRSAMWNHYSYWFDIIGDKLNKQLGRALSQFQSWRPTGGNKAAVIGARTYVSDANTLLNLLTSREFAAPIDELVRKIPE